MYIRLKQQNIHYRVSQAEVSQLLTGQTILEGITLAPDHQLSYSVTVTNDKSRFTFKVDQNLLQLKINRLQLKQEISERPSKQGIVIDHENSNNQVLAEDKRAKVYLEIDLKRK